MGVFSHECRTGHCMALSGESHGAGLAWASCCKWLRALWTYIFRLYLESPKIACAFVRFIAEVCKAFGIRCMSEGVKYGTQSVLKFEELLPGVSRSSEIKEKVDS